MNKCFNYYKKIIAIGTKKFVLGSILYGGNHSPNSLNIMHSTHTLNIICHKSYYYFQVINKKKSNFKNTNIMMIDVKCKYCN